MKSYRLRPPEYATEPLRALALNPVNHLHSRDERPLLAKIEVLVFVLNGKQDPIITPKVAEMVHQGIRNCKILLIGDCGHFPFSEQPETTTAAVLHFINSQTGKGDDTNTGIRVGRTRNHRSSQNWREASTNGQAK